MLALDRSQESLPHRDQVNIYLGAQMLRRLWQAALGGSAVFILVTLVTDLGFQFEQPQLNRILALFDLKLEGNVAVWFSSALLFVLGFAALLVAAQMPARPRHMKAVWLLAALFFVGLSVDETAQLHEAAGRIFTREVMEVPALTSGGGGDFGWLIALAPLIVAFLAVVMTAARSLILHPPSYRLAIAGVSCWIGVIPAEFVQSQLHRLAIHRSIEGTIEEGLEIVGTNLLLASLLGFLRFKLRNNSGNSLASPGAGLPKARGLRLLRRFRRRNEAEVRAFVEALQDGPHAVRTACQLIRFALQHRMKPQDTLLYDLDCRPAVSARDFLTKRSQTLLQDLLNPSVHHHLVMNKLDYHVACFARGVPAPPVLAVVDFGPDDSRRSTLGAIRIMSEADMEKFLNSLPKPTRLVFKPIWGSHGHALLGLTVEAFGPVDIQGRPIGATQIIRYCDAHRDEGGFLVQAWLEPDPALRPIMPGQTLGTVRVVTLLAGDEVRFPFSFVKIPVGANVTDAFNHGKSGNLIAEVDVRSGRVGSAWGPSRTRRLRLEIYPAHPETGAAIEGFQIPRWQEVLRVAAQGARAFPELKTLGWDIAITPGEVFLLEANHHWDPHVPQVLLRRGFRPDMEALVAQAG